MFSFFVFSLIDLTPRKTFLEKVQSLVAAMPTSFFNMTVSPSIALA